MELSQKHIDNRNTALIYIKEKIGKPVNKMVLLTALESNGIRDKDTLMDYGTKSIMELATILFSELIQNPTHGLDLNKKELELAQKNIDSTSYSNYRKIHWQLFFKSVINGFLNLMPILFQLMTILFFGYSMWTSVEFNPIQSTAVVIGVAVGMIVSGGFVQVIGRQASFYWSYNDITMVKKIINFTLLKGTITMALVLIAIFIINLLINFYTIQFLYISFAYALLIGLLILHIAPLYPIKQRWFITVAIVSGSVLSLFLVKNTNLLIYYTHWIGLLFSILICKLFIHYFLEYKLKKSNSITNNKINIPVLLYHNYLYFFYGFFLYLFVFIDRFIAWSSEIDHQLPFIFYFQKDYELGMDIAVISFLFLGQVLEYSIVVFTHFLDIEQKLKSFRETPKFNAYFKKLYWRQATLLLVSGLILFCLTYTIIHASWGYQSGFNEKLKEISYTVAYYGCAGYLFLAWGMMNSLYLFTLGKATIPLKAIIAGTFTNLLVGFALSRLVGFEYSVVGMLAGSMVFFLVTLKPTLKVFDNLAYHYYASY